MPFRLPKRLRRDLKGSDMMVKACVTFLIIAVFALFFAVPLVRMANDNEEYKSKEWFKWAISLLFVLFVFGTIGAVVFGILAIWI